VASLIDICVKTAIVTGADSGIGLESLATVFCAQREGAGGRCGEAILVVAP
jgi:hypothetical protein